MTNINFDEPSLGQVNDDNKVALEVRNNGKGGGIRCIGTWQGLLGESLSSTGVVGVAKGEGGVGVRGETEHDKGGAGVVGKSKNWVGVYGESKTNEGVRGVSESTGVIGVTKGASGVGVFGQAEHPDGGTGVLGKSSKWAGVYGESTTSTGVWGKSVRWAGVYGESTEIGIFGKAPVAGRFEGDVEVTGDIRLLNADCAEDFDVSTNSSQTVEPGTVMVLKEDGNLEASSQAYDKKVAGVISGAGGYKPGIVLDKQQQKEQSEYDAKRRMPLALLGKVYCKVEATTSPVEVGDLLTTSSIEGHAMKASDPIKAFGTVIGKALRPLKEGSGMIPVLVALQ